MVFDLIFTKGFFHLEIKNGHLYGIPIDILNNGSRVMLLSLGMTLVIATGGVDLSVGAVMAIAGAVMGKLIFAAGVSFPVAVIAALLAAVTAGVWNGVLVSVFKVQPLVATLILMVAGRGAAQLITNAQIVTFTSGGSDSNVQFIGNGFLLGLPFPVLLSMAMLALTILLTRKTAAGLFIESVGDNPTASSYAGVNARTVKLTVYTFSGLCAGMAGLVDASSGMCADPSKAGLYFELDAILAVVVGGTALTGGRFYLGGAIVGALFIQSLTTTMYALNVPPDVAPIPKALAVLIVCLIQSPAFRRRFAFLARRKTA
jgi:simple sugar transport system permease protein